MAVHDCPGIGVRDHERHKAHAPERPYLGGVSALLRLEQGSTDARSEQGDLLQRCLVGCLLGTCLLCLLLGLYEQQKSAVTCPQDPASCSPLICSTSPLFVKAPCFCGAAWR